MDATDPTSNPIIAELDPWERINRWPEDRPMKSSEAAVFMTFSLSKLEAMRVDGTGPDYFQGGMRKSGQDRTAKGTNQHVRYFKADINAWWKAGKVSSTMHAAILKGQTFVSIMDLAAEEAFYLDANGHLAGRVEGFHIDTVIERLDSWDIAWMPATEAASRTWSDLQAHKELAEKVSSALSSLLAAVAAGVEGSEIADIARSPKMESERTLKNRKDIF